jgi:uncharacterized protein YuzE
MKIIGVFVAAFLFLAVNTTTPGEKGSKKEGKMHGQIVNVEGFNASIQWDAESMKKAAREGNALGFYDTQAEKLYVVRVKGKDANGVNEMLMPYIGVRVNVKGTTSLKDTVNYLDLTKIEKTLKEKS